MARICRIRLENVRVFSHAEMQPGPALNLIVGNNGAGKTSLLEAIYLAGRGRSFRHPDAGPMLRRGSSDAQVVLTLQRGDPVVNGVLGVRRGRRELECRFDGSPVRSRSKLAELLPLLFISSTPQTLVASGPETRRRFLDMAMFHVEPDYLSSYLVWMRALRQRNAALASGDPQLLSAWDRHFRESSLRITESRAGLLDELAARTKRVLKAEFALHLAIGIDYRRGWSRDQELEDALLEKRHLDIERGFTSVGPQRADLILANSGQPVDKVLSRGQLKVLVISLNLALIDLISESKGSDSVPLVLIDDLGSELDRENQAMVLRSLRHRGVQGFVALLDPGALTDPSTAGEVFHVEQGTLRARNRV
jgi:DNA replication and repair protein RecF